MKLHLTDALLLKKIEIIILPCLIDNAVRRLTASSYPPTGA